MNAYYLTPKAAEGIENIWDYIAGDSGVSRADKVVDDIFTAIENLAEMLAWVTAARTLRTRPSLRGRCTPTWSCTATGDRSRSFTL